MRAIRWFLGTNSIEPVVMEDVDLENRIFRDHRLPVHQERTERNLDSGRVVPFPRKDRA